MNLYNRFFIALFFGFSTAIVVAQEIKVGETINMFDKNLSKWELWMGAVHTSVDLDGVEKFDNVHKGTPLGLNNDPKKVFSVNDKGELHITGEIYGGLTTKSEYANYHLKVEMKWGEKKWAPRLEAKRDSGILYHAKGPHGTFWNVWKHSLEYQVQEEDCGDFIALGQMFADLPSSKKEGAEKPSFDPKGEWIAKNWKVYRNGNNIKYPLNEKPNGEWNTLEIYVVGGKAIHLVNGTVVNALKSARMGTSEEDTKPIVDGQIQLQSEGAELFYRNMTLTGIKKFPKKLVKQIKWK